MEESISCKSVSIFGCEHLLEFSACLVKAIDEMAIEKLDDYVNQLKTAGHDHLNRSALMRDVIRQLQTLPNKTERIQASY